jgi:hypothetical protein
MRFVLIISIHPSHCPLRTGINIINIFIVSTHGDFQIFHCNNANQTCLQLGTFQNKLQFKLSTCSNNLCCSFNLVAGPKIKILTQIFNRLKFSRGPNQYQSTQQIDTSKTFKVNSLQGGRSQLFSGFRRRSKRYLI